MNVSSSPDLLGYSRRNRTILQLRDQVQTVSQEAVTGLRSDVNAAVNGDLGRAHLLQKSQSDLEQSQEINTFSTIRIGAMTRGLTTAREAIDGISTRGFVAINSLTDVSVDAIANEAESTLRVIMGELSRTSGDRNMFAGDKTNSNTYASPDVLIEDINNLLSTATTAEEALTAINDYFDTPGGEFDTNIYLGGDSNTPPIPLGNGQFLQPDINGKNQEFKDTLKGLALMSLSGDIFRDTDREGFNTLFTAGTESVGNGVSGIIELEGEVGVIAETLGRVSEQNDSQRSALALAFNNIFGRDQFEAAAELQLLQNQLEASYTLTSTLSNLTLTNYLR